MTNRIQFEMIQDLKDVILKKKQRLIELKILATSTGGIRYDKELVQTSKSGDSLCNSVLRYCELEKEIEDLTKVLNFRIDEAQRQIATLPDERQRTVLTMKYIDGAGLFEMCDALNCSRWTVWRLESSAFVFFRDTQMNEVS